MLSRRAREFAAEIFSHDWSDAPYRLDRAGHQRSTDTRSRDSDQQPLSVEQTDYVRTNVVWVVAQVLRHEDPNLDIYEFAAACGVPRSITHRTNGSRSGVLSNGLRWSDQDGVPLPPGAPLWRVRLQCEIGNLVVFKRLLNQVVGLDPSQEPEVDAEVEEVDVKPVGGATRLVTIAVRGWDENTVARRAAELVSQASLDVANGSAAVVVSAEKI
ncbi:hypothetical protein [Mycobacterium sp.]|uniref:hypothetical protein n=1 Tax=Mycobacterium sp. TaxID=1785 RepID=UPI0025DB66F5|nr:hypothetical protein [Mycobacterium sp.]